MFIVLIHYKKSLEQVDQQLVPHRAYLEEGYKKNFFIASGPQNPRTGGVILSQLTDKNQLLKIIEQDPFFTHEIADFEVIEFNPVKFHPEFKYFIQ